MSLWLLVIFIVLPVSWGNTKSEIVAEARKKLLAKDRLGAVLLLRTAITAESDAKKKNVLLQELNAAKSLFFTSSGQKLFEQAESARLNQDARAATQYMEALKDEAFHVQILEGLALTRLEKLECKAAAETIEQIKQLDPQAEETQLFQIALGSCEPRSPTEAPVDFKSKSLRHYERTFRARQFQQNGQYDQAIHCADEAIQLHKDYPSAFYWAWKSRVAAGATEGAEARGEQFLELCKGNVLSLKRTFRMDPWVCQGVEDVRKYMTSLDAEGPSQ